MNHILVILILLLFILLHQWIIPMFTEASVPVTTIAYEASGESMEAQLWVGAVIRNRMRERGQTASEVCLARYQFSCYDPKTGKVRESMKKRTKQEIETAEKAWTFSEFEGTKANLYRDISISRQAFLAHMTYPKKVKFIKQIGRLVFYYEKR